jgi:ATP-dependent helicase/nuclease subunit B
LPKTSANLILGPARSGKSERALERYAQFLAEWQRDPRQPGAVWISPDFAAVGDTRDRLAERCPGAFLAPRILTFAALAEELIPWGKHWHDVVNTLEKLRIIEHVVNTLLAENRLRYFAAVAQTFGFHRQVSAAIADFKRRDVWPEDFKKVARTDRDRDFALIYAAYQAHLQAHGLYDAEGRFWAAREMLQSKGTASPTRFGLVVVDGFADFTTAQHDLLRLLAERTDELLITLPADHGDQPETRQLLFDKPRRTLERLRESLPKLNCQHTSTSHFAAAGIAFVERELFRENTTDQPPTTAGLEVVAASSAHGEIREIARRSKSLLHSGECSPNEVAVVFPNLNDVSPRVREIFDDFGVPTIIDDFPTLRTAPFVRDLTNLLELHTNDWSFDTLLNIVGNRRLSLLPEAVEGTDPRVSVERTIRRAQIPEGQSLLIDQVRHWAASAPTGEEERAQTSENQLSNSWLRVVTDAGIAEGVLSKLSTILNELPSRAPITEWTEFTRAVLEKLGLLTAIDQPIWRLLQTGLQSLAKTDQRCGVDRDFTAVEFLELIQKVANCTPLPRPLDAVGRVRILSAEMARTISAKHVFVAGLSEQSYSSAEGSGQLYRGSEVERFIDDSISTDSSQQAADAMLLFYDVVTRASHHLTFSYSAYDDKGQTLPPSPFLIELQRCLAPNTIPTTRMPVGEFVTTAEQPLSRTDCRFHAVAKALDGDYRLLATISSNPDTRAIGQSILNGIGSVASRGDRELFSPFDGILLSEAAQATIAKRFDANHLWSASQLETYANCPYQFFGGQLLRLEPLEGLALRTDYMRRGNLLHQILAAIHSQIAEPELPLDNATLVERFSTTLMNILAAEPLGGLEGALREIESREVLAWATQYAEQEISYRGRWNNFDVPLRPTYFEVRFGPKARGSDTPNDAVSTQIPFTLDLGGELIKLTGQIDRIDVGQIHGVTVFNIIDYKSGQEVRLADKDIEAGRQLQLPLYALAAEQHLLADKQAVAFATGYWSIKAKGFPTGRDATLEFRSSVEGSLADSERWGRLDGVVKQRLREIVHGIRSAEFAVYNENDKCTSMCDFSKICRVAQLRSLEKIWIPTEIPNEPNALASGDAGN